MEGFDYRWLVDVLLPVLTAAAGYLTGRRKKDNDFLADLQRSIDLLSEKNTELVKQVITLEGEVVGLRHENGELRNEVEALRKQNKRLSDEVGKLRKQLSDISEEAKAARAASSPEESKEEDKP